MKFNFDRHMELIPTPEKDYLWDRIKIEKPALNAEYFHDIYPNAKLEYLETSEIPTEIKNQLIWRILRDTQNWESPKPVTLFRVIHVDGSVNYCAKYVAEFCDSKIEGDEIELKIKYTQDMITFFDYNSQNEYIGYGAIKVVNNIDDGKTTPIPDIVNTESAYRKTGIGGERYFLMNALCKTFFSKPLFSSPSMVDEPIAFWKKLTELGGAKQIYTPKEGSFGLPGFMFTTDVPTWKEFKERTQTQ